MANYWWVGGGSSSNWSATTPTNWSIIGSGGVGGATVPGSGDDIFFDSNSGSGTANADGVNVMKSLDCNGYTGTIALGVNQLVIGDSSNTNGIVRFGSGMTWTWTAGTGSILIGAVSTNSGSHNFTSNGVVSPRLTVNTGGTHTLTFKDDFSTTDRLALQGSGSVIDASDSGANHNVTAQTYQFLTGTTVTMGNGTWTGTGTGTVWSMNAGTTVTPGSSTVKLTANSGTTRTFAGAGKTYNNLWHAPSSGAGQLTITGANTFADFKDNGTAAHTISFPASTTQTFTTFTVSGNAGQLISLISSSSGTAATLSKSSGTVNSSYLSIKDSAATGGATWNALTSTNVSGNSGWIFPAAGSLLRPYSMEGLGGGYCRSPMMDM